MTLTARSGAADPFAHQMLGPWYSGMAQGIALSPYARLAQLTEDDTFRDRADQVWQTLTISRERSDPWVTVVDDDGHYWIEERPQPEPTHALNGKIFGIYGLYSTGYTLAVTMSSTLYRRRSRQLRRCSISIASQVRRVAIV